MHTTRRSGIFVILCIALFIGTLPQVWALGPREVILWEHGGFRGRNMVWNLDHTLRHKLVPDLQVWFNDKASSVQVGSEVKVILFRHVRYAGPSVVFSSSAGMSKYWNDQVSSLIIFPRHVRLPPGVVISDTGFNTATGYERRSQFFPIPEPLKYHEANYPVVGGYINDRAKHLRIQGEGIEVIVCEHTYFFGTTIHLPSILCEKDADYRSDGYHCVNLSKCPGNMEGSISSLRVRLKGGK